MDFGQKTDARQRVKASYCWICAEFDLDAEMEVEKGGEAVADPNEVKPAEEVKNYVNE